MHKEWLWASIVAVLLSACTATITKQQAPLSPYLRLVVEIGNV